MTPPRLPEIPAVPLLRAGEHGYLMITAAVMILIFVAILSSVTFVFNRDSDYRINYALGERLAEVAVMAHNYAQVTHFSEPVTSLNTLGNLFSAGQMNPPDALAFDFIGRTDLALDIRGRDLAPEGGVAPAPTAYLHLKIRPDGVIRRPSEDIALLAGAAHRGMDRVGIVGINTGPNCGGAAARVRWGPEGTACLNNAQITAIGFTDVQDGDIIVPAWEAALSRIGEDVILRFPQPERPDLNMMNVDMQFAPDVDRVGRGYSIGQFDPDDDSIDMATGATMLNTSNVDAGTAMNTIGDFRGTMTVREGSTLEMNGGAITNNDFTILDVNGNPTVLEVSGAANFPAEPADPDVNISVSNRLTHAGGPFIVTSSTETLVDRVGNLDPGPAIDVTVDQRDVGTPVTVAVEEVDGSTIQNISTDQDFNVSGTFDTTGGTIRPDNAQPLNIYAAEVITAGTAEIVNNGDWNIGAIDQRGTAGALQMENIQAQQDCIGSACPDNITDPPDDPPF